MAMTLITTNTSSNAASSSFTSSIDSTYKLYIFKFLDINPATDGADFTFQVNAAGASGYNETVTSTLFRNYSGESAATNFGYQTAYDQAQGTAFQILTYDQGNATDECMAGELHLFNPSSTTYVKHFYTRTNQHHNSDLSIDNFVAGYFNITAAVDEVQFKMDSGNFDGTIKMYGVG